MTNSFKNDDSMKAAQTGNVERCEAELTRAQNAEQALALLTTQLNAANAEITRLRGELTEEKNPTVRQRDRADTINADWDHYLNSGEKFC